MEKQKDLIDWSAPKYPKAVEFVNVGDTVEGTITEIGEVPLSDRLAAYMHIDTTEGKRTLWLGKVLNEAILKAKKGDYIGVRFLGTVDSGKQSPYKDFDTRIIPVKGDGE